MAVFVTFLGAWGVHLHQRWALTATWVLDPQDFAFWTILGGLTASSSARELRSGQLRPARKAVDLPPLWGRAWRTALFFAAVSTLWSFWTVPTFDVWLTAVRMSPP